jgi:hypothetical protein
VKIGRSIILAVVATVMATPGLSQSTGSHIRKNSDARTDIQDNDPNAAEKAVHFLARCTAELRSPVAKKILALPYLSAEQKKIVKSKVRGSGDCMNRLGFQLRYDFAPLVGGMAEYFVTDIFKDKDIELISEASNADRTVVSPSARNSIEMFSQCVARKDPKAVKSFVSTQPTSDAEKKALQSVIPFLGQCIPEGEKISLDKISLRAMLSFGLFRELAAVSSTEKSKFSLNAGNQ